MVVVTLKNNHFKRYNHQRKLANPTSSDEEIYKIACSILSEMWQDEPIRLIGIRLDKLTTSKIRQISLFDKDTSLNVDVLEKLMDEINDKYGSQIIKKASTDQKKLFHKRLK